MEVMSDVDYLIPQKTPDNYTNSYYSLGVLYKGEKSIGMSWQDFRNEYVNAGGDGIYGAWSVPYLEPLVSERRFINHYPEIYKKLNYQEGLCPVAEGVQKQLMQFKTNYRDFHLAEQKADILLKIINKFR